MSRGITHWRPDITRARAALDALPDRAVIIDKHGDAWQKSAFLDTWYRAFDGNGEPPSTLAQNVGTVVAVHEPDEREEHIWLRDPAYPSHIDHHDDPGSEER